MKRLFLTLAIAAIGFTGSYAQDAPKDKMTPAQKAEKSTAKLQKELSLSADQKKKIYAIELDKATKGEEWHKKNKDAKKAQKAQHDAVKKSTDDQINKVLTPDQQKKLSTIHTEKKEKKDKKEKNKSKPSKKA